MPPEAEAYEPPPAAPPRPTRAMAPSEPPATYDLPQPTGWEYNALGPGTNPPIPYEPAPPPPEPPRPKGGLLERVLLFSGETTPADRDRVAQEEFEQAIAPVLDLMRASVPGANTPEEAQRILAENQGEVTPDPKGGAYVPGDAFDADARVYYRLLRRDYESNPRPSEKKKLSHHLHQAYNRLPGTRGW